MIRFVVVSLLVSIATKSIGQDSSRLISYQMGINFCYAGQNVPDFTFPFGFGIGTAVTFNKFSNFKPTIELTAAGFPEYAIRLSNNNNRGHSKNSYGLYNFLAGTKYKLNTIIKVSLMAGPSLNSIEKALQLGVRPSLELNTKKEKIIVQLYYFNALHSIVINDCIGMAILFKIR